MGLALGAICACAATVWFVVLVLRAGYTSSCIGLHANAIFLALSAYAEATGHLPPPYVADKNNKPMHSWRVLLLPYLGSEAADLYKRYDFNEAWDGPHNRLLADEMPAVYRCPAATGTGPYTSYVAVVGQGTVWSVENSPPWKDLEKALDRTVLIVEIADSGIQWMEPRDLTVDEAVVGVNRNRRRGISSNHPGGACCVTFLGGAFLKDDTRPEVLRALLTDNGKDLLSMPDQDVFSFILKKGPERTKRN